MKAALVLMVTALFTGCTSMKGVAKAFKNDPAIVVVRMGTPWGNQSMTRIGGTTNSVTVSPEGNVTINQAR